MIAISPTVIDRPSGVFNNLITAGMLKELHLHDGFFEIMIILRGSLTNISEGETRRMVSGDMAFLPNGTMHTLSDASENLMFLNVAVLPLVFAQAVEYLALPVAEDRISFAHVPDEVVEYILWHFAGNRIPGDAALQTAADRMPLLTLLPYCKCEDDAADWFDRLLAQMRRRDHFRAGVKRMQEMAFCSSAHLSRICKARIGMTPTQYVERIRMEYAAQLLAYTDFSIRDVGIECGFCNLGYFYRRFEALMGETPGQYRLRNRE